MSPAEINRRRELCVEIYMDEKIEEYIVNLVEASRNPDSYGLDIGQLMCHDSGRAGKKIRYTQIYTSKAVNDSLAGVDESVFKDRGMEFDEVREYGIRKAGLNL